MIIIILYTNISIGTDSVTSESTTAVEAGTANLGETAAATTGANGTEASANNAQNTTASVGNTGVTTTTTINPAGFLKKKKKGKKDKHYNSAV